MAVGVAVGVAVEVSDGVGHRAAALVDAPLASELKAAAAKADPGLKISLLDAENHRLRVLLVAAQSAIEEMPIPAAKALNQRIWQLLESIEAKRAPRE